MGKRGSVCFKEEEIRCQYKTIKVFQGKKKTSKDRKMKSEVAKKLRKWEEKIVSFNEGTMTFESNKRKRKGQVKIRYRSKTKYHQYQQWKQSRK